MTKANMRLVGGPPKRLPMSCYQIRKAEASDTRLMGVVGLYVHWVLKEDCPQVEELKKDFREPVREVFQVYCFELEDGGLDRVSELEGKNSEKLGKMRNGVFGGLGGKLKALSPREALWIIASWSGADALRWTRMPAGVKEVMNIAEDMEKTQPFTTLEKGLLMEKLCVRITTDYGLINYYIMRSVCYDEEGAKLLASSMAADEDLKPLRLRTKASLIRNKCELFEDKNGEEFYLCESFLDTEGGSWIMTSVVKVDSSGICFSEKKEAFRVTSWESYRKLLRPEYLTYFDIDSDLDEFNGKLERELPRASCKMYDNGVLYMDYNTDNDHVERPVFNIGDDLKASYFVTAAGQLVMASFSDSGIMQAETLVRISGLDSEMTVKGRYSFTSPVLGSFVESGFDDFDEYLNEII